MEAIELALEELRLQDKPNIAATAKKHGIDRSTLSRRFNGKTVSIEESVEVKSLLNNNEQKVLIKEINRLSELGCPPTVPMVSNFAREMSGKEPGINWGYRFVQDHKHELVSVYLKGFDLARKKADSWHELRRYFELVSLRFGRELLLI